ncbi:MAG: PfkB family carbohydrate kinase, partial [Acidimicrobiales bacterium]
MRVVVLGSLNADHTMWVDRLPGAGESLLANGYTLTLGGKGFNQAVTVARQGARVTMVGCVGDDEEGDWLIETMATEGVDTDLVVHHASLPTGRGHITVGVDGSNTVVVASGANAGTTFPSAALEGAAVLLAQLECPLEVVGAALAAAKAAGIVTVLNAAPAAPLASELLTLIDYLVVNEPEARVVAADPASGFPGTLIVT